MPPDAHCTQLKARGSILSDRLRRLWVGQLAKVQVEAPACILKAWNQHRQGSYTHPHPSSPALATEWSDDCVSCLWALEN